jgi:cobalt/nickel transport system permease protein
VAHIHLQDGTLPFAWAALWWAIALVLLAVCLVRLRGRPLEPGPVTLAAFCTATVFALSQIEIPILGGVHLSLMPLSGILLGPLLGSVVALVANVFSAAVGHGGWSVIGANVLVNVTEIATAWTFFRTTGGGRASVFVRGAGATFLALFAGTLVMIGIVAVSGIQGVTQGTDAIATGLVAIGAINLAVGGVEAIVTGYLLAYLARVRPDILGERPVQRLFPVEGDAHL